MTSIEKKTLLTMAILLSVFVGSCVAIGNEIHDEFGRCKGLEGAVNKIWTGEDCGEVQTND